MQLAAAIICDHASVREGLLTVIGGGVTRLWRETLPAPLGIDVALLLELHRMELERPHEIAVEVRDQDGQVIAGLQGGVQVGSDELEPGESQLVPLPIQFSRTNAGVTKYGPYSIDISVDSQHLRSIQFRVLPPAEKRR